MFPNFCFSDNDELSKIEPRRSDCENFAGFTECVKECKVNDYLMNGLKSCYPFQKAAWVSWAE